MAGSSREPRVAAAFQENRESEHASREPQAPRRSLARRGLAAGACRPTRLLDKLRFQSVMIIQPADIYEDGRQNMCDGCPDMTVYNGRLVWSCRLEEPERFGDFVQMVPRRDRPDGRRDDAGAVHLERVP